jgi:hypothetical protein
MKLSPLAEIQLNEIQYSFGCSKNKAISYALESLHAFENIRQDQVLNFLDTYNTRQLQEWEIDNQDKRVKIENN